MRVLVIGATGFVGRAIIAELRNNSIDVIAVGGPGTAGRSAPPVDDRVDVTDDKSVTGLERFPGVTHIIHAAGLAHQFGSVTESDLVKVNVSGTKNVAKLAGTIKVKHLILISSVLVYGRASGARDGNTPVTEEFPCWPDDAYARSKLNAEKTARELCEKAGIPLTILRPSPIIGEGNKGNFRRLIQLISRRRFIWLGDGRNLKSLVSIDDVARVCRLLLDKNSGETEIFNVSGPAVSMLEIVNRISKDLSRKPPSLMIPAAPVINLARLIPGDLASKLLQTMEKWTSDDIYSSQKLAQKNGFYPSADILRVITREVSSYTRNK